MDLDLGGVVPLAADERPDMERLLAVLVQMQKGQDMLTDILTDQKAEIEELKMEVSRLKARTNVPKRQPILMAGGDQWRN